ncbi:hypothetical protein V2J09_003519 [Rumex salicifolius]
MAIEDPTPPVPVSSMAPTAVDFNDPLWLPHTERSNYSLSTQLLNENNYYKWRRAAEISLKAKAKMSFVSGDIPKPAADSPTFPLWERCNSMVTSWFFHSVEKDIAESLLYFDTAAEIWADLQVQKELFTVSQGSLSVSSYYTNFRRLWDEFVVLVELPRCSSCDTVGVVPPLLFTLQVVQFLVGLNDVMSNIGDFNRFPLLAPIQLLLMLLISKAVSLAVAAFLEEEGSSQSCELSTDEAPSLTKDQYNQLIALLSRSDLSNSASKTGLMTGPFNEQINGTW